MSKFTVRTLLAPSGERLPLLLDRSTGMPVFYPNLYVLTALRQTNRASATIERALREISVLYDFLAEAKIDLVDRMRSGRLLALGEIDGLASYCRQSVKPCNGKNAVADQVLRLEAKASVSSQMVSHTTSANRLRTIHAYLTWLIANRFENQDMDDNVRSRLEQVIASVLPVLKARVPVAKGRNSLGGRKGLSTAVLERVIQDVAPTSPRNPWKSEFVRLRNALIMYWLRELGLRRGELLNVKISDIDFRKNEVMIARRADDKEDPRRKQPKVKTRDRILPLSVELANLTHDYIIEWRSYIHGARKHRFLFVSAFYGHPMSLASINKLFNTIKLKIHDMPNDLSPHVMRHTWNDEFSDMIDGKQINEEKERQMRSYLMGWSPTSSTASIYTKRFVRRAARRASLEMQEKITRARTDE